MKLKTKPGLINGDIVESLLDICNEYFVSPFVQPYAGVLHKCRFCGAIREKGEANHSTDCPVIKYRNLGEKYKKYIVQKAW